MTTEDPCRPLLTLLADGRFHSGEALAQQLGISRTAVWKRVRRVVEELGVEVEGRSGKGYRLLRPLELLDAEAIATQLQADSSMPPPPITVHTTIDSTNRWLLSQAVGGLPRGSVALAEVQSAGRGRRGRQWVSPFGGSLCLSLLHRSAAGPGALGGLSIAAGLVVAQALRALGGEEVGLKWPNDLLWRGRKLGGLLVEVAGEQGGPSRAVIGLGLNLQISQAQGSAIDQPWVDLEEVLGGAGPGRNRLVARLISGLRTMTRGFEQEGPEPWLASWGEFDLYRDRPVVLTMGTRRQSGICRGIDQQGALLLEGEGGVTACHGGEVSLRPG